MLLWLVPHLPQLCSFPDQRKRLPAQHHCARAVAAALGCEADSAAAALLHRQGGCVCFSHLIGNGNTTEA